MCNTVICCCIKVTCYATCFIVICYRLIVLLDLYCIVFFLHYFSFSSPGWRDVWRKTIPILIYPFNQFHTNVCACVCQSLLTSYPLRTTGVQSSFHQCNLTTGCQLLDGRIVKLNCKTVMVLMFDAPDSWWKAGWMSMRTFCNPNEYLCQSSNKYQSNTQITCLNMTDEAVHLTLYQR